MFCVSRCKRSKRNSRTRRLRIALATGLILVGICRAGSNEEGPAIDLALARTYFSEARALSDQEAGSTWGRQLYGPMLFVDRATRTVIANQSDRSGLLRPDGGVFVGSLPDEVNCANTATDWAGVRWTMLVWPLPDDARQRARLMMHECFHRIQDDLGLPMSNPANRHLDNREGRTWIQLEWRALDRALSTEGKAREKAVRDALAFREWRQRLFEGAAQEERRLELNEGLAEYTGVRTAHRGRRRAEQARAGLAGGPRRESFMRSFAYASGPAYGLLLDAADGDWRDVLAADSDLGLLLARGYGIEREAVKEGIVLARANDYDGPALMEAEADRDRARQAVAQRDRRRLLEGPILILTLGDGVRYSFNPSNLRSLEELGTVYPTMRVTDRWGVLEVDGDALMLNAEGRASVVHVVAPAEVNDMTNVRGEGWVLNLEPGWSLEPADRIGDYRITGK